MRTRKLTVRIAAIAIALCVFSSALSQAVLIFFSENFNTYSGKQNNTQADTGLEVAYGGTVAGWSKSGTGTLAYTGDGSGDV